MPTTSRSTKGSLRVHDTSGRRVTITVEGREVEAVAGEPVLAAIWADGPRPLHRTARAGAPRAFYCGIGVCFDCLVTIDGEPNVRACMTPVAAGMTVEAQRDAGWQGFAHA